MGWGGRWARGPAQICSCTEKFGLLSSALPLLSSWAARLLPQLRMSGPSPEQESPVQSPACSHLSPPEDASRVSTLRLGGCCPAPARPPAAHDSRDGLTGLGFASVAAGLFPTQHQNTQQLTNSLTRKENGPRVLLTPPTDRLHSLQTYNNTKEKKKTNKKTKTNSPNSKANQPHPTSPNFRKWMQWHWLPPLPAPSQTALDAPLTQRHKVRACQRQAPLLPALNPGSAPIVPFLT